MRQRSTEYRRMVKGQAIDYVTGMKHSLFADVGPKYFTKLPFCVDDGHGATRELAESDELLNR